MRGVECRDFREITAKKTASAGAQSAAGRQK
jgi:hypothetical protein